MMFSGTLRENLDFDGQYADVDIWKAIESCHCSQFISDKCDLDENIESSGTSLSIGARQLLCLARSVLERRKVVFF